MNKIVLASRSPRRSELLDLCGISYTIDPSDIDEVMDESLEIDKRIEKLAYDKTVPTFNRHKDEVVVGADTIVYIDNEVIGKAKNREHAKKILEKLSGNTHQVITGVCLMYGSEVKTFSVTSDVIFYDLSEQDIEEYLDL
ncbi:MAG: Maf family protein, partial [Erysipelotrichaceae bacterium]|nr:Maf family protein [Erysipelotrichaceae bacterium]